MYEKTASEKHIEMVLHNQREASEKARQSFEKSGDPQVVIDFLKNSLSGAAIKQQWVLDALQTWLQNDKVDLLKQAFLPRRGENAGGHKGAIEKMMFVNRIDNHRKAGKTLENACIAEAERAGGDLTGDELFRKLTALKNKYHRAKRIKTEVSIQETPFCYIVSAFPAKIEVRGLTCFGRWSFSFPKK